MRRPVTTWYLELDSPERLLPAREPEGPVQVVRAEVPSPEFSRFLYTAVGGDIHWIDRLGWNRARWQAAVDGPGRETWVAWERGTPAGFVELAAREPGEVEIVYFGLLPDFRGRGIGGHLLHRGAARAFDLAERWEGLEPTRRVWVHTCSLDGEYARATYAARGFVLYETQVAEEDVPETPGPWPGALS